MSIYRWDLVSIPQRNPAEQKKAIDSLCCYAQLCSRFIPLVRDPDAWQKLYNEDITHPENPTTGALATYINRGWCVPRERTRPSLSGSITHCARTSHRRCRLEILAGLAPKKFITAGWRPGPRNLRFRFHHDPTNAGIGPLLTSDLLKNPIVGNFTVDSDRDVIVPVLELIAQRFAEYAHRNLCNNNNNNSNINNNNS